MDSFDIPRNSSTIIDISQGIGSGNQEFVISVWNIIRQLCNLWKLVAGNISVERLQTAMSNYVFVVSPNHKSDLEPSDPAKLLLRIYGELNVMYDRATEEAVAIQLANAGLIPRFFGVFGNGRIEEFVENTPLCAVEFREINTAAVIAKKLRDIHVFLPTLIMSTGIAKEDKFWDRFMILVESSSKAASSLINNNNLDSEHTLMMSELMSWGVYDDHSELKVRAISAMSPLVFGHCDCHHGNVLCVSGDLKIIDFEYAIPTARGVDMANFFCEFCSDYDAKNSHDMDFSLYPIFEDRSKIIASYLGSSDSSLITEVDREINAYLPFVHLQWAHWAMIKALGSHSSSFDHIRFAYNRFKQFVTLRQAILR